MESSAFLFQVMAALVYLALGGRLLRLALRTRELPEGLLGSYFLLGGVSYLLYEIPTVLELDAHYMAFAFSGRVLYDVGLVPCLLFLRLAFHRDDHWAGWLVGLSALLVGVGLVGSIAAGDYEGVALGVPWFWLEWVGYTLPFGWIAAASLAEHRRALLRLRIGLVEPQVANRYLLWGLFGATQVAVSLVFLPMYAEYARTGVYSTWSDATVGMLEIGSLTLLWLVFFAPAPYRRLLEGMADPARAEGG